MTFQVLSGALLICMGLLLGTTWTIQALKPRLRRLAEERRQLNEEWSAVRAARRQHSECPRCAYPLSDWDRYFIANPMEHPSEDD